MIGERPRKGSISGTEIRTLRQAAVGFVGWRSPRRLIAGVVISVVVRCALVVSGTAPLSAFDSVALVVVVVQVPIVEWLIHRTILHARPRQIGSVTFDPGAGHRNHHQDPDDIAYALLRPVDAPVFQLVNGIYAFGLMAGLTWLVGQPALGPGLTAVMLAMIGLLHYEWSHYLFHTAYRPKSRRYRRLKANHRRHHWRDERAWLGITTNAADRALGTLPSR